MYLTKEDILSHDDRPTEEVDVPEWGGVVRLRAISGKQRDALESEIVSQVGKGVRVDKRNIRARFAALAIVDENGELIFSHEDIEALGNKSAKALDRIFAASQRLNGLSDSDVEELAGNSESGRSAASG